MSGAILIYSDELAQFEYGDDHPFKPMRARNTLELCNRYSLLHIGGAKVRPPVAADRAFLELFHESAYLDVLKRASEGEFELEMLARGIGSDDCPPLPGVFEFSLLATGATKSAVDYVLDGEVNRSFNLVGGFHHSERDHAEGFCYVNDAGAVIEYLLAKDMKVAFVDIDAHHCNGIQNAFYDNDRLLCISLHETGETLYPFGGFETEIGEGAGKGYNVNIPLLEKTDDEVYIDSFESVVPPLLEAFAPDIVIAEIGADTVVSDPLTHLRLTSNGYEAAIKRLCDCSDKLVALGGGGYDVFRSARCWTLAWAAMSELEPEDDFAGMVGGMMYGSDMDSLHDPAIVTKGEDKERAWQRARKAVDHIHKNVFPILDAKIP